MYGQSMDMDLIRGIINRVVAMALGGTLTINSIDHDTKNVEYCPVWTLDKNSKQKKLLRIKVRMKGQKIFSDLDKNDIASSGLTMYEMLEYLDKSDAVRVRFIP
jgi:hypothetical protein